MFSATRSIKVNEMFQVGDIVLTERNPYYAYKILRKVDDEHIEVKPVFGFGNHRVYLAKIQDVDSDIFYKKASARME